MAELVEKSLENIIEVWRPGSHGDDWTWIDEYNDLWTRDKERTWALYDAILKKGFRLADDTAPIKLGNDGRVWNGHHRLVIALAWRRLGYHVPQLMVEIVPPEEKEHGE